MTRVLYCNSFEISHTQEAFQIIFVFKASDGKTEAYYIVMPPSGVATLYEALSKEIGEYTKRFGGIAEKWTTTDSGDCGNEKTQYLA